MYVPVPLLYLQQATQILSINYVFVRSSVVRRVRPFFFFFFFLSPPEGGLDLVTNRQGAI